MYAVTKAAAVSKETDENGAALKRRLPEIKRGLENGAERISI